MLAQKVGVNLVELAESRRAQLPNLSHALLQAFKLRTDLRFHGVL
jgi:hypothetical protein